MSQTDEAWTNVGEQLKNLGSVFRQHYDERGDREVVESVSEDKVREAMHTLGESLTTAFGAVGDAITDPDLQVEARQTVAVFFDALGTTFSEIGTEISKQPVDEDPE